MNTKEKSKALRNRISTWARGQRTSGHNGLGLILDTVDHMLETHDWTCASRLLVEMEKTTDFSHIKSIIRASVDNVRMKADPSHPEKYVFSAPKGLKMRASNNLAGLRDLHTKGHGFRDKAVKEFITPMSTQKNWDSDAFFKRMAKQIVEHDVPLARAVEALQATVKELKAAK